MSGHVVNWGHYIVLYGPYFGRARRTMLWASVKLEAVPSATMAAHSITLDRPWPVEDGTPMHWGGCIVMMGAPLLPCPAALSFSISFSSQDRAVSILVCALVQTHRARSAHRRVCLPASAAEPTAPPPRSAALTALPAADDSVSVVALDGDVYFSLQGHVQLLSSMPEQLPCVSQHLATLLYGSDLREPADVEHRARTK